MEIKNKILKYGFSMLELGFSTWPMGGYRERDLDNDDERDINAIKYAIDLLDLYMMDRVKRN